MIKSISPDLALMNVVYVSAFIVNVWYGTAVIFYFSVENKEHFTTNLEA